MSYEKRDYVYGASIHQMVFKTEVEQAQKHFNTLNLPYSTEQITNLLDAKTREENQAQKDRSYGLLTSEQLERRNSDIQNAFNFLNKPKNSDFTRTNIDGTTETVKTTHNLNF
ncbi:MAG: hypothetical protein P1U74_04940 [Legionellaceae bacterium]|nr:hypothetical protein [Legionellaceae bacterium]